MSEHQRAIDQQQAEVDVSRAEQINRQPEGKRGLTASAQPRALRIAIVSADYKLEMLRSQWNGMIAVTFDSGYERYNYKGIFPLADPTPHRCSLYAILCACEVCKAELAALTQEHDKDPNLRFAILSPNASAVAAVKKAACVATRGSPPYLVRKAAALLAALPPAFFALEYASYQAGSEDEQQQQQQQPEEGGDRGRARAGKRKKGARPAVGSIKDANTSLMETHRVVFENPKQAMGSKGKKKRGDAGRAEGDTGGEAAAEAKKKAEADEIKERTLRMKEQSALVMDLLSAGTPGASGCRRRCKKPAV